MKIIVSIIFALCLSAASLAEATSLSFIKDGLQGNAAEEASVVLPEPTGLEAHWWRYFAQVEGEKLEQRIQEELQRLESLSSELPEDISEAAASTIELIRVNLQALPQARSQASPELPTPIVYGETYTLPQFLAIAKSLRDALTELEAEHSDVSAADKSVKAANRRVDTLMAAYLGLDPSDPTRVLRGLEIMAERSAAAVAEERLRVRKAALLADEGRIKQLKDEQGVAAKRLLAEQADLKQLDTEIEQARKTLEQAQDRTVKEQAWALSVVGDDPEKKAAAHFRQQRVLRATVLEAIAESRLIRFQVERYLVELLLDTMEVDTGQIRTQLAAWDVELGDIRTETLIWVSDSERERQRTGDAVASSQQAETSVPVFIQLINQDRFNLAQETLIATQRLQDEIMQADLIIQLVDAQLAVKEGRIKDWLARGEQGLKQLWAEATGWGSISLFKIGETPVTALGLLRIALILTIAWWISHWLRRALQQLGERGEGINLSAYYTVGRLSHYLIIVIGFMVGLSSIGVDFTNFALVAGAIAIGIGFGLQSIVNNFVSGLILLFERSLKVGDFVELTSGVVGEVRELNVRSTLINTNDNIDIVVPNSEFMNNNVNNWTLLQAYRRIHLPFRVAYGTDKDLVRQAGLEAAEKVPHTLTGIPGKNPGVWLISFGENGLEFELVVWVTPKAVKRPNAVHATYMWEIESALRKYAIEVPFPQRDLYLRDGFQRSLAAEERVPAAIDLTKQ